MKKKLSLLISLMILALAAVGIPSVSPAESASSDIALLSVPEDADESFLEGLSYIAEEKYYSAREAFLASSTEQAAILAESCILPWPETGELWHSESFVSDDMILEFKVVQEDPDTGMYFMVFAENGELASTLFVLGEGTVSANLPGGRYRIQDASGTAWYGEKEVFGKDGFYERMIFEEFEGDDYLTDLEAGYLWTISINVSPDDISTGVDADETDWDTWTAVSP